MPDYARLWNDVRLAAESVGARAWLFNAEGSIGLFTEFIEWQGDSVLGNPAVENALNALNSDFFPGESGIWQEAQI